QTVGFVARSARLHSTVHRRPDRTQAVDVLHDVQLADPRPVAGTDTTGRRAKHPERGPVAQRGGPGDVRLLDRRLDAERSTRRRLEIGAPRLYPAGRPGTRGGPNRLDDKVARTVVVH